MLCPFRELRHQSDRGRAGTDDHHAFAVVVEVFGPFLRMHDASREALATREYRRVAVLVAVVTRAHQQEAAAYLPRLSSFTGLEVERPCAVFSRPLRTDQAVPEANSFFDVVLGGRFPDVPEDRRTVRDCFCIFPGFEAVAERVHVAVRANARVAKQVPGSAYPVTAFQDDEVDAGKRGLKMARSPDARQAGTDDDYLVILAGRFLHLRAPSRAPPVGNAAARGARRLPGNTPRP